MLQRATQLTIVPVIALMVKYVAPVASAQDAPQIVYLPSSIDVVRAISADGSRLLVATSGGYSILTLGSESVEIPVPSGAHGYSVAAISGDGATVAGYIDYGDPSMAFWTESAGWFVPTPHPYSSYATAISADGSTIVGSGRFVVPPDPNQESRQPMRWSQSTGFVPLASLSTVGDWGDATVAAADGHVIGGESANGLFRWAADTGFVMLDPMRQQGSSVVGISEDGSTLVGRSARDGFGAYRWTMTAGFEHLAQTGPPSSVSGDARTIVGFLPDGVDIGAFIWTEGVGTRYIRQALAYEYGLTEALGWRSVFASVISADGLTICGSARLNGMPVNWWVRLVPCCAPSDMNCDARTELADLAILLSHFGACSGDAGFYPKADIDRRGCVDLPDLATVLAEFGTDCPQP